ncbi:MAG: DUF2520 domain-containing protein [Winogradskyella sp.]|uniref:Rossmann-like and DUF2520 domain-containing protein n=1 Tax=Winogradskyella sp. TaxID=1883156 RepID=UPI00181AC8D3|nr:Rossmann-like and DUF2520 domain-containing protein [Winogradskyella sp.]MBT8243860.1 DUF2520 domain-containing protein [Winogradskyella sp.]NNK22265.1 DUF2520 domain-containing protein [Winogradskyella sp.]
MITVTILGAGNVASHLYRAFSKSKSIAVKQWYNRTFERIKSFQNETEVIDNLSNLKDVDIYVLAVTDDAVAKLSEALPFDNRFLVHTSGSVGLHDLDKKNSRGVFYPLQSFSKDAEMDFANVPFCIETEDKSKLEVLKNLAEAVGSKHYKISTEQRQTLHLSAVFVNNFANQLYRIAHEISDAKSINFEILKPLIAETANKVQEMSPYMAQTGPAKRNDIKTLKKHFKLLENEEHSNIYELLTQSIQKTHGIKYPYNRKRNKR